eukprot:5812656-Ditylum_brightwellii.AAC.1
MVYLLHQQQTQHAQYQQAVLSMQAFQQNLMNQLTMGMINSAVEVLRRVGKDKPTPQLVVPVWTPSNKRELVLYNPTPGTEDLTEDLATAHPEENSVLSNRILKLERLHAKWLTISHGPTEKLINYTTRVQEFANKFAGTSITITQADVGRRWRLGLGYGFDDLNKTIRLTRIAPEDWEEDQSLTDLMETAELYLQEE